MNFNKLGWNSLIALYTVVCRRLHRKGIFENLLSKGGDINVPGLLVAAETCGEQDSIDFIRSKLAK